jgi:4-carboxymuconolactone decarboxylase
MALFQKITTELCWNFVWNRDGLDRKTRSMLNTAMLAVTGRSAELALHVRGAINNGVSVQEIQEVLVQVTVYAGIPAGLEGFKVAHRILREEEMLDESEREPVIEEPQ